MRSGATSDDDYVLAPSSVVRSLLPGDLNPLVGVKAWEQVVDLCKQFSTPVQTVCFECRLGQDDNQVDLAFCIMPGPETAALAAYLRATHRANEWWARFAEFLENWIAPGSELAWKIPFACVAFDLAPSEVTLRDPCVSLCIDPEFFARRLGMAGPGRVPCAPISELARICYFRLTGTTLPTSACERLESCLVADATVEPKHISLMLSRRAAPLKLDVSIKADRIGSFLAHIGWPGPPRQLQAAVSHFIPWATDVQLNLILHPGLAPPLEVEVFCGATEGTTSTRQSLLDHMVATGVATAPKASVLRDMWLHPVTEGHSGCTLARSWYVKLRFTESGPCDAKAYVGVMPRRFRVVALG